VAAETFFAAGYSSSVSGSDGFKAFLFGPAPVGLFMFLMPIGECSPISTFAGRADLDPDPPLSRLLRKLPYDFLTSSI